ncbi:metal-dependent hydrolase [Alphaproteobacteria bacterium]|nr:metal-dependent hydrolase [Alphaproteobacteria bacterium]
MKHGWGDCDANNEKNIRTRSSIILETETTSLLIDMSPDLRQQLLKYGSSKIDGVIFTHEHYDHTCGINELRPVFFGTDRSLEVYSRSEFLEPIKKMFYYLFASVTLDPFSVSSERYASTTCDIEADSARESSVTSEIYKPYIVANTILDDFQIGDISGICFEQDHGYSKSMGIRVGNFAYTTDVVSFPEESFSKLYGLDTWIVGCLAPEKKSNHAGLDTVLKWVEMLEPKMTYLTHMSIHMDYDHLLTILPSNVRPAYDQMQLEVNI